MPARFCAYPPDAAALVRSLEDGAAYRIGRAEECELRLDHPSVSRLHDDMRLENDGWRLRDTGSKNGVRVDGHPVKAAHFKKRAWFAVGDVYCSFETVDPETLAQSTVQIERLRAVSRSMQARLSSSVGIRTLIPQTLDFILELSGLERGFVLYGREGEPLRVRASRRLAVAELASRHFDGSASVVQRALASRKSVICCDTTESSWLGERPSVRLGGIRAVACIPLQVSGNMLGVVYADSHKPDMLITENDQELLESIADHAATALNAQHLGAAADSAPDDAAIWEDIRRTGGH